MTALWILGILLFILLTVLVSRVGAEVAFGEETRVTLRLGLIRCRCCPGSPRRKERLPRKKRLKRQRGRKSQKKRPRKSPLPLCWRDFRSCGKS